MRRTVVKVILNIAIIVYFMLNAQTASFAAGVSYVIENNKTISIPTSYNVKNVIMDLGENFGTMYNPQDIFIDSYGFLYVADTGNNRIIKMDKQGNILKTFYGPEKKPLLSPNGIYVDRSGDIYIADTGNKRVIHLSKAGKFIEEFGKPDSELLGEYFTFEPSKICISPTGLIYVIKGQSFFIMDAYNRFRGYIMPEKVGFSFSNMLIRIFASKEQKKKIEKKTSPPYSNLLIDNDGMIYATSINTKKNQIQKINSIGRNIYIQGKAFGEFTKVKKQVSDQATDQAIDQVTLPYFVDIAVDNNGIISVLEQQSGKIYQYDMEGNLLAVLGGIGNRKGTFNMPTSIAVDNDGCLYVLDAGNNNIQVFEPTKFIRCVHDAVGRYFDGKYEAALESWQMVMDIDANYKLAHKGIAMALMKKSQWKSAMREYREADDQDGYSKAFKEYRHEIFRNYFVWVIFGIIIIVLLMYRGIRFLYKDANRQQERYANGKRG